jgi:glycosyltransferase involved in cell wall biosynthesis
MRLRPVRILYLADIRFPLERANGIQTIETCHALARRGHDVALLVRPDTAAPARDPLAFYGLAPLARLTIERAPAPRRAGAATRVAYLACAVRRASAAGGAEVVFTRDLGVAAVLSRIPRPLRPPLVYESHGYAPEVAAALPTLVTTAAPPSEAKVRRLARREARVWAAAEGYVTITAALAADLIRRLGTRTALAVIADGARPPEPVPPAIAAGRPFTVAYAGHLYPWKGVEVLIEALAQAPDATGVIVGGHEREPDLDRVRALAASRGLSDRVTFTGLVPPFAVSAQLAAADVLVLPNPASAISTRFTSPLKLFEYMAAGRAIVASDLPAIREVIEHEVQALLVPPGDAGALAGAIRRLADDPALRDRLGRAARARVADFTWDRRAERLEALLARVVDGRG